MVDSTGLKFVGDGEWIRKKHGLGRHRMWRKMHLGVDPETGEILAGALSTNSVHDSEMLESLLNECSSNVTKVTGDGGYDYLPARQAIEEHGAKAVIPLRRNAVMHRGKEPALLKRNLDLCRIREVGKKKWEVLENYHQRNHAEVAMFRYKKIIGDSLSARKFENQKTEMKIGLRILNMFAKCGMPSSIKM